MRFSSISGTTSATVASATRPSERTRKSRRWGEAFLPSPKLLQICQASLNATPAPQRSPQGYVLPGSRGWTSTSAPGRSGPIV